MNEQETGFFVDWSWAVSYAIVWERLTGYRWSVRMVPEDRPGPAVRHLWAVEEVRPRQLVPVRTSDKTWVQLRTEREG